MILIYKALDIVPISVIDESRIYLSEFSTP